MASKLRWHELEVGAEIPPLVIKPTNEQLVRWAGASGDFYPIHYDKDFALSMKFPNVVIQGPLKGAWFGRFLGDWVGQWGVVRKFSARYRLPDYPGDTLICRGKITSKHAEGNDGYVECDLWIENSKGDKTTTGTALVILTITKSDSR